MALDLELKKRAAERPSQEEEQKGEKDFPLKIISKNDQI
tara:strand:+ start:724 stop:840 length:117 start_codon:yes stop_codon:yes gene_type:complete